MLPHAFEPGGLHRISRLLEAQTEVAEDGAGDRAEREHAGTPAIADLRRSTALHRRRRLAAHPQPEPISLGATGGSSRSRICCTVVFTAVMSPRNPRVAARTSSKVRRFACSWSPIRSASRSTCIPARGRPPTGGAAAASALSGNRPGGRPHRDHVEGTRPGPGRQGVATGRSRRRLRRSAHHAGRDVGGALLGADRSAGQWRRQPRWPCSAGWACGC